MSRDRFALRHPAQPLTALLRERADQGVGPSFSDALTHGPTDQAAFLLGPNGLCAKKQ